MGVEVLLKAGAVFSFNRTDARTALATMTLTEYHPIQAGNRSAVLQSIAKGHGAGKETTQ